MVHRQDPDRAVRWRAPVGARSPCVTASPCSSSTCIQPGSWKRQTGCCTDLPCGAQQQPEGGESPSARARTCVLPCLHGGRGTAGSQPASRGAPDSWQAACHAAQRRRGCHAPGAHGGARAQRPPACAAWARMPRSARCCPAARSRHSAGCTGRHWRKDGEALREARQTTQEHEQRSLACRAYAWSNRRRPRQQQAAGAGPAGHRALLASTTGPLHVMLHQPAWLHWVGAASNVIARCAARTVSCRHAGGAAASTPGPHVWMFRSGKYLSSR